MRISYNWLKNYISPIPSAEDCARLLTDTGLEVESMETYESVQGGLRGLVIGEVIACIKHPNADRLSVTQVNINAKEPLKIVCGAPNVAVGQKVVVAMIGAVLCPTSGESFEIKQSKIRGERSQGMICAEDEIGLGKSHDGIMILDDNAEIGSSAADYFKISTDTVFEIGLTPNRVDAASHYGTARDLYAALYKRDDVALIFPALKTFNSNSTIDFKIEIENKAACPRYSGICISGVKVEQSPTWLKNALSAIGLKSINNVVDITNYVLHELGHPLHAFDLNRIKGNKILVKTCSEQTSFVTLDGIERKLSQEDLMICNAEEPMCIAGVFGGLKSGVNENTTSLFIESAYFNPVWVRKTSKRHGLKTDASFRFERGADPEITLIALQRAVNLILEVCGGEVSSSLFDVYKGELQQHQVNLSYAFCDKLIGQKIDRETIKKILERLGITLLEEDENSLKLKIPFFKPDVTRAADVVEEILRIYGYNNIGMPEKMRISQVVLPKPDKLRSINHLSDFLVANGFTECMNNSLSSSTYLESDEKFKKEQAVKILNPLSSELDIMRNQMLFGLLENLSYNINRQSDHLKLFEFGRTYHKKLAGYEENEWLALTSMGNIYDENWLKQESAADFHFLRGMVEQLLKKSLGSKYKIEPFETELAGLEHTIALKYGNSDLAYIGLVKPSVRKIFGIQQPVVYALIDFECLFHAVANTRVKYAEVPKFPKVKRDLALLIDQHITFHQLEQLAYQTESKILKKVNIFDIYQGDKLASGKKSYALSFEFVDENKTLSDTQIEKAMQSLIDAYGTKFGAKLR